MIGRHHEFVRTTVAIDDDALANARAYAKRRGVSLGQAVTELIRQGLDAQCRIVEENGLYVLTLGPDAPRVTSEDVYKALEDWP